ncbi:MAG TPA: hypothetical protein VGT82_00270 [Ktedonobacteraceae bacterium]|nr:hypothetical protein [Ktedonobacteraceae bacterium]
MQRKYFVHQLNISLIATFGLFLSLLLMACGTTNTAALAMSSDEPVALVLAPHVFTFKSSVQPMLLLRGDVCQVHIGVGNVARVAVHVTVHHYRANRMPTITYTLNVRKGTLTIEEKLSPRGNTSVSNDSVDFNITVPLHTNMSLNTQVGNFAVNDVVGQMVLATNTGSITASHIQLRGQSSLSTNVGSITFSGAVARNGTYRMDARVGTITAAFPAGASFQVAAQTSIGAIESDISSVQALGAAAQGTVGRAPYAHVILTTRIGSIFLQQA